LADGNGTFAKLVDLELDLVGLGLGIRSKRYVLVAEDGVVKHIAVDGPVVKDTTAEAVLPFV
jgi:peroxiredoxin